MDQKEVYNIFASTYLFKNVNPETIDYAVKNSTVCECKKGQSISQNGSDSPALYIITRGSAVVSGISKSKPVILNTLTSGTFFGMASLFGEKCSSTSMIAKEDCTYALLSKKTVEELFRLDMDFTENYICFLSDKIRFLNKKIAFFTSENAEKKVAGYLLSLPYDNENKSVDLNIKMSNLAQNLDIGRASLYRSFDSLEGKNFIRRNNNTVNFTSYDEFKKIYGEQK